eukprot:TRINITY_DN32873_c0_g1_i1.p1 TRINITY_DN32873_c0_g1~~TRINITY_DN32873_c0_g1_i1.p1  ORF type:complete len:341 (-),score=43.35 TRINITY_DN32873_c0_g1_i1:50-1072(-)
MSQSGTGTDSTKVDLTSRPGETEIPSKNLDSASKAAQLKEEGWHVAKASGSVLWWTVWSGELIQDFSIFSKEVEHYANYRVFQFWDFSRGVIFLVSTVLTIVSYHAFTNLPQVDIWFGTIDFRFIFQGPGGVGQDLGARFLNLAAFVSQLGVMAEILSMLPMVRALRKTRTNFIYKIFRKLHRIWHRGKPPFVPIEVRANMTQNIVLALGVITNQAIAKAYAAMYGYCYGWESLTTGDLTVLGLVPCASQGVYFLVSSSSGQCGYRSTIPAWMCAGELKPCPQAWNGLKIKQMCFGAHGPEIDWELGELHFAKDCSEKKMSADSWKAKTKQDNAVWINAV